MPVARVHLAAGDGLDHLLGQLTSGKDAPVTALETLIFRSANAETIGDWNTGWGKV
jgi:hypothetical protein